jgi:ferredoxin
MTMFTIDKMSFHSSVAKMIDENLVYGVKRKRSGFTIGQLYSADELCLDYDITLLPPNKYLLPSPETLLRFSGNTGIDVEPLASAKPSVILGVHAYDLHAVRLLDAVFAKGNLRDMNYVSRRNATTIIGVDCLSPWPYSFAASMGTSLPPNLFDLWLTDQGEEYLAEVGTSRGRKLLHRFFTGKDASNAKVRERARLRQESLGKYQLSLDIAPEQIPSVLEKGWDSPMWEELGQKCFSCGSCTMVCPTCICFDVRDRIELSLKEGERSRRWDSCMFDAFDKVATGENFRPTGTDRLRHRLNRKGRYMLERWGELGCVGCGRCVHACLVDIASPVYAYNRLAKEQG